MSLNPILILDHVIEEYRDYIRSEFRAKDPALRTALETELDRNLFLAQEPFYQAHRPFLSGAHWSELPLEPSLARAMVARTGSEAAFLHQSESISHLLGADAASLVVTTGTGSGKTECFLLPVIQNAIQDSARFSRPGLTAILVYPMNALANDQLARIEDYLSAANCSDAVRVQKYDRGTSRAEREEMRRTPPHILLTNYMMLEYLLVRPADREAIFANHRSRFLVLDEVHTYRGVLGSNIALLIRRLRAHLTRARQDWRAEVPADQRSARFPRLLCVGTSATIKNVTDEHLSATERVRQRDSAVSEFFCRLTGETAQSVRVIGEVLEQSIIPTDASVAPGPPALTDLDIHNPDSVRQALCVLAGIPSGTSIEEAARKCQLLWLLNRWLITAPMSVSQILECVRREVPARSQADPTQIRSEVELALLAGSALPERTPGALRLRAHRLIRGGWRFTRCVSPGCGRIYPMGEQHCACGRDAAPLYLCRSCGADYLRFRGEPDNGPLQPDGQGLEGREWMLYDRLRQDISGAVQADDEDTEEAEEGPPPRRRGPRQVTQVRGEQVREGSFDVQTLTFSSNDSDYPFRVKLVPGRTRCVRCGGTAGSRAVLTPVMLGTSAAVKVLSEGLVDSLADANRDRPNHDGKERLLVFSDSRQDAAHQARFIIFASRYDRMRRRLVGLLREHGPLSIQRSVELFGESGVAQRDNPHVPVDYHGWLADDEMRRIRAWEEAPLLDEISVTPFYRGTLINLGSVSVLYHRLNEYVHLQGEPLRQRWNISEQQLQHLCRCFLDECRLRAMLSREMLRYHPNHTACPDYVKAAAWERKVKAPKGLPANSAGRPAVWMDLDEVPYGISVHNAWRRERVGGRSPSFQRLMEHLLEIFGAPPLTQQDGEELLLFLFHGRFLVLSDLAGSRERGRFIQLNEENLRLYLPTSAQRMRCGVCSTPLSGAYLRSPCPRCHGTASPWSDAEVEQHRTIRRLGSPTFVALYAQEHTAQVPNAKRAQIEANFKAPANESALNLLACSPTMEMGIDVGGLDAIVLRNVPPRPDNYAQRGGRAGRRTRIGLVVGYARSTPHDQYFYDHPEEMISGEIPVPSLSLGNRDVILRHLSAIAFGAAEPGLAGRMLEYVNPQGQINTEAVTALVDAVRAQTNYSLELARIAWGQDILIAAGLTDAELLQHLSNLPARIQDVVDRTARQVIELRQALDRYAAQLVGRQPGTHAADLVARLLGVPAGDRANRAEAEDTSAGYPLRRFAEFGILPGYEFPSEPASLRLLGDPNEEDVVTAARRVGIYQFMPDASVYARSKRWKVIGLDNASPWNPRTDVPWHYRKCRRCGLRYATDHPRCPRCEHDEPCPIYPAYEFGGFIAQRNEAPVLDEEDRLLAKNLVICAPQWDGEVFERWASGPGWSLQLRRGEEVRWLNEGPQPTPAELEAGFVLHNEGRGFNLCPVCGRKLTPPQPAGDRRAGRRQARRDARAPDTYGHAEQCAHVGQPPQPCGIVTFQNAETLRLLVWLPEAFGEDAVLEWGHSLGAALRIGIRRHFLRVASASVRDDISAAAVVFTPEYGSEDDHQIRSHICSRDCAGSTSPDSLAPAA